MENTINIILRMMKNDGPVIGATLAAIFLLLIVMVVLRRQRRQDAQSDDMLVKNPTEIDISMDEKTPNLDISASLNEPALLSEATHMPDLDTPRPADENADLTIEMTRELDGNDTVGKLAPEHAFSIEINETDADPSLIAPNFAADPSMAEAEPDATPMTDEADTGSGDDEISIPRQGSEAKPGRFALFGNSWMARKEAAPAEADAATDAEPLAGGEPQTNIEPETDIGTDRGTDVEAREVTPDAIASAVADLVGDSQAALATATAATDEMADSGKAEASLTMAREMDEAGVIDEIEHLAEVERKMRALRELFQAGLIAPEVYLLKAREYASEGL
ncbi:MAG: hypothetical protein ACPG30_03645 [Parvibaculales bacterium]